jgi:hypothetical protein
MTRFADVHTRLTDDVRTRQIARDEALRVERQFAPVKARAAANAAAFSAKRTFALA